MDRQSCRGSCLFFDLTFLPIVEKIAAQFKTVKYFVAMTDRAHMPASTTIPNLLCYEELLAAQSTIIAGRGSTKTRRRRSATRRGRPATRKACSTATVRRCCTRSPLALPDTLNFSGKDVILPVVPMFHVNAWGIPYAGRMVGAKLVFPGPALDGKSLYELMESGEGHAVGRRADGVAGPARTTWSERAPVLDDAPHDRRRLRRGRRRCCARSRKNTTSLVLHAWGMTEMSPARHRVRRCAAPSRPAAGGAVAVKCKQGRAVYGVDMKIVDARAATSCRGTARHSVELYVRGPWVVREYFRGEGGDPLVKDADGHGWFPTGDVATIDPDGYMQITDRSKDVIKSGGEWISSIDIENVAMAHPCVPMAACIAAHPEVGRAPAARRRQDRRG